MKEYLGCLIFAFGALGLIGGCLYLCNQREEVTRKYYGVTRVFMHTSNYVSVFIPQENGEIQHLQFRARGPEGPVKFISDIPLEQEMWVLEREYPFSGIETGYYIEVHIHDVSNVEGGDWDHGKFGSGRVKCC